MTTTTKEHYLTAGAKRIMGVAQVKRLDSPEVLNLVRRWGGYIDQSMHPKTSCKTCHHALVWDSEHSHYIHVDSKHRFCSTHAGRTANV